jgi:hypothetical protein
MQDVIDKAVAALEPFKRAANDPKFVPKFGDLARAREAHAALTSLPDPGEAQERVERILAGYLSQNKQPVMSGDMRDRLNPRQRRECAEAARAVLAALRSGPC